MITPNTIINDTGALRLDTVTFKNAGGSAFGPIALRQALQVSSDVFFYNLGLDAEQAGGNVIQDWAENLGLGQRTGIDLPEEVPGLVPTPSGGTRSSRRTPTRRRRAGRKLFSRRVRPSTASGAQATGSTCPWVRATSRSTPSSSRSHTRQSRTGRRREAARRAAGRGLERTGGAGDPARAAAARRDRAGASAGNPRGPPRRGDGAGRNLVSRVRELEAGHRRQDGNRRTTPLPDQSWYVALAPYPDPKYVVAVTIERGGFGADSAAPAAAQIVAELLGTKAAGAATAPPTGTTTTGSYD